MRKFLLALALALAPALAPAQTISVVESVGGGGSAIFNDNTQTFALSNAPVPGTDAVCFAIGLATVTGSGIATAAWSDASAAWVIASGASTGLPTANSGAGNIACTKPTTTETNFTITTATESSGNIRYTYWHVRVSSGYEFGALTNISSNGANGASSPHSSGSVTPTSAVNIVLGLIKGGNNTYTNEAGWSALGTPMGDNARGMAGYLIQSSATAQSYDPTTGSSTDRIVIAVALSVTAAATILTSPTVAAQGTTITADLNDDGYTFAAQKPIIVDQWGKIILWAERVNGGSSRHRPVVSNDTGATWLDPTISGMMDAAGEGFLNRSACAYDSINDLLHCLWEASSTTDGMIYRRYAFTRDGSHNISAVTRVSGVSLQLDADANYELLNHPSIVWQPVGTNGQVLCVWGAYNATGTPNKAELRGSMRVLSNSTADNTAGNWKAPVTDDATTITIDSPVPYSILYSRSNAGTVPWAGILLKAGGTHVNDVYLGFHNGDTGASGGAWSMRRMPWDSGNSDWSNTLTTTVALDNVLISGTDSGYSLKYQLGSQLSEDVINDRVYFGYAIWNGNTNGDTWSVRYLSSSDTASSRVDIYAASGAHAYAPTGDVSCETAYGYCAVSYIKQDTFAYTQVLSGTTVVQTEQALFTSAAIDIPLLAPTARYNDGSGDDKLLVAFRDAVGSPTPPYDGYFGKLTWLDAPVAGTNASKRLMRGLGGL